MDIQQRNIPFMIRVNVYGMLALKKCLFRLFIVILVLCLNFNVFFPPETVHALPVETLYQGVDSGLTGDDYIGGASSIGFSFVYYQNTYTTFQLTTNGLLCFNNEGSNAYTETSIPSTSAPNNCIFAFWDDLYSYDINTQPLLYKTIGTAPNRELIAQWTNYGYYNSDLPMGTFQVILYESTNNIRLQYRQLLTAERSLGQSAAIGLEGSGGTTGIQYSYDTASLTAEQSILWTWNGSNYSYDAGSAYEGVLLYKTNPPPTVPVLSSPSNGSAGISTSPVFSWEASENTTSYTLTVSTSSSLSSPIINVSGLTSLSYSGSGLSVGPTYYWGVKAVNSYGESWSSIWHFTTAAGNSSPTDILLSNDTLASGSPGNTLVGTLSSVDQDSGNTFTYTLVSGAGSSDNASFSIVGNSLYTAAVLSDGSFTVRIRTTDQGGLTYEKIFTIEVAEVNQNPTDITLSNSSVSENEPVNTAVGTLSTTDADAGNTFTYTLVGGEGSDDNASFNISGASLRTSASFNYEVDNSYTVRIRSTDQGGLYYEEAFTITITDANDAPVITSNEGGDTATVTISENTTAVTTVTATDTDPDTTITYSINEGADGSLFSIGSGTGVLTFTSAPDFETKQDADANNVYVVQVQASDGSLADTQTISVTITNENETPTDISLSETSVEENQPMDTVVGTLSTTDPDASNTFTYTLVSGEGSDDNASFHIDGSSLLTSASFNKEDKDSYSVRIRSTDQGDLYTEESFTITITNVNEAPTDITLDNLTMDENQDAGTVVGGLTTTDVDAAQTFTYSLVSGGSSCPGTDNAHFQIDDANLVTKQPFNFEEDAASYEVCIRSADQGDLSTEKAFTITLEDINDVPEVKMPIPDQTTEQDTIFSFTFANDTFYDQDGDALTYSVTLEDGSALPAWLIFTGNMHLFAGTPLEGDTGTISIKVTADDGQGGIVSDIFTLSVSAAGNIDPVQNYPLLDQTVIVGTEYTYTIEEGTFVDPDSTEALVYTATLADGENLPDWLTFNPVTYTFSGTPPVDLTGSINIKVNVYDVDGGTISDTFTLEFVTSAENQAPYVQHSLIDKNATQDTAFLYTFAADTFKDPDDDALTYEATLDSGDALPVWLTFVSDTRTFSGTPGADDVDTFLVKVTATDIENTSVSSVFRIAISEAGKEVLYKVVNPSGNTITDEDVQVIIPPNLVSAGTHPYLHITSDIDVAGAPSGFKSLDRYREITLSLEEGQLLENFTEPIQVCFALTSSEISNFSGGNIRIGTRTVDETSWTLLNTTLDSTKKMACASVNHFSYYGLFVRIVSETIPKTGFAPGVITELPQQAALSAYQDLGDLWIEIPSLGIKETIVGVYPTTDGWDISWLGNQIGWLNTTAYPTWAGNSVLTGHVVDNNGQPGIFYYLHQMGYGDQIIVHLGGLKYVYEVRTVNLYTDPQASTPFQHEELPWITLITCRQYDEETGIYQWRTVVRAVQVEIQ